MWKQQPASHGSSGSQWAVKTVARVTVNLIWRHGADRAFTSENPEKHQPQLSTMKVSKPQLHFLQEKTRLFSLPVSPWTIKTMALDRKTEEPAADPRGASLVARRQRLAHGSSEVPTPERTKLLSSNMAAAPSVPHSLLPPQTHPKGLLLASFPAALGSLLVRGGGRQGGREEVGLPLGPHHLHWPHRLQPRPGSPQFKRLAV